MLRYSLIGAGLMGREHIRNLRLLGDAKVAAIADPDDAMRARAAALVAELWGGDCAVECYAGHRELLAAGEYDAIIIASPNDTHAAILHAVLDAPPAAILCEKPVCTTAEDCRAVMQRAAGRAIWVAMEYRYMPPVQRLLTAVADGAVGAPKMMAIREHRYPFLPKVGDWNRFNARTGGTLVEKCCHFWDLMRLALPGEPVRVFASAGVDVNHLDERYDGRAPDIGDNAFVVVDFAGDGGRSRAMLDLCMFAEGVKWQEEISVVGDVARADALIPAPARFAKFGGGAEVEAQFVLSRRDGEFLREEVAVDAAVLAAGDHHGATYFQHVKFRDMVRGGGGPEVGLEDGLWSVRVGEAAEESARTGAAVLLTPP